MKSSFAIRVPTWSGKAWLPMSLAVLLAFLGACRRSSLEVTETAAPEVLVATVQEQDLPEYGYFTGRVASPQTVELHARVSGYVIKADFEEGTEVKAGTLLFEIDPRPYQAALEAAKATVARWEAMVAKAQADLARNQQLAASGAVSKEELDLTIAEAKVAEAELRGAQEAAKRAQLDLEYTKITAPIDGRVGRKLVTVGNLVAVGAASQPLTTLVSVDPMHVYFAIDEPTLVAAKRRAIAEGRVADVDEAQIRVDVAIADASEFQFQGLIDFVDNQVDPTTATIQARAVLPNPQRLLTSGMFARVRVQIADPKPELLVDERAIGTDLNQRFVYVVDSQDTVGYRAVVLGPKQANGLRVVRNPTGAESLLKPGDRIIIEGIQRVRPGMKVSPKQPSSSDNGGAA